MTMRWLTTMRESGGVPTVLVLVLALAPVAVAGAAAQEPDGGDRHLLRAFAGLGPGSGSRIGVAIRDVEAGGRETPAGAVITDVRAGSPAESAGFQVGDAVVEFDGERVRSARQLTRLVQETPSGRPVVATVRRGEARLQLDVTPAAGPAWLGGGPEIVGVPGVPAPSATPRFRFWPEWDGDLVLRVDGPRGRLGLRGDAIGGQLADYFGVERGVLVAHVEAGSVAAVAGIRAGDVITAVGDDEIEDVSSLRQRLAGIDAAASFTVTVTRDRVVHVLSASMSRPEPRRRFRGQVI